MSVVSKISGAEFDSMVERGAFDGMRPRKIELIRGELRFTNRAGPLHDDYIYCLTRWSIESTTAKDANVRIQCGFICDDNRSEPDVVWFKPRRYGSMRPTAADVFTVD